MLQAANGRIWTETDLYGFLVGVQAEVLFTLGQSHPLMAQFNEIKEALLHQSKVREFARKAEFHADDADDMEPVYAELDLYRKKLGDHFIFDDTENMIYRWDSVVTNAVDDITLVLEDINCRFPELDNCLIGLHKPENYIAAALGQPEFQELWNRVVAQYQGAENTGVTTEYLFDLRKVYEELVDFLVGEEE